MRTTWNGSISFGLVSIPVGLAPATAPAARQSDVQFRMLHRECLTPIKQKRWCPVHDIEVASEELVRGWEVTKGQFVPIEDEELEALEQRDTSRAIEITRFVGSDEVDPSSSTGPTTSSRPAPRRSAAPTRCCSRRCARTASSGSARSCSRARRALPDPAEGRRARAPDAVRREDVKSQAEIDEAVAATTVKKEELALAHQLIGGLQGEFDPSDLQSEYRTQLRELLSAKAEGRELPEAEEAETETP